MKRECAIEGLKQTKIYTGCLERQKVFIQRFICIMTLRIMSYTNPCRDQNNPNYTNPLCPWIFDKVNMLSNIF